MNQHNWDLYFLRIAKEVAKKSKCMSRKIGTVLVKDNSIISTGFNGAPRGVKECHERNLQFYNWLNGVKHWSGIAPFPKKCPRRELQFPSGKGLHLCQAGHGERNALIQAGRNGVSTKGTTLYCYCGRPCKDCVIEIINAGVTTVVHLYKDKYYDEYSKVLLEEAKINIRIIKEEEV